MNEFRKSHMDDLGFRTDGAYLSRVNILTEGYYADDKYGNLKKKKYGFFKKVSDIFKHGQSVTVFYKYIYFHDESIDSEEPVKLIIGSSYNEFTTILMQLYDEAQISNGINYDVVRYGTVKCFDDEKTVMNLNKGFEEDTMHISYYSQTERRDVNEIYTFYKFPSRY